MTFRSPSAVTTAALALSSDEVASAFAVSSSFANAAIRSSAAANAYFAVSSSEAGT